MAALHLLLDAGSLGAFDLHVQRKKRKKGEGSDPAGSHSFYPKQGETETEGSTDMSSNSGELSASLGPNASMYKAAHISTAIYRKLCLKHTACLNANSKISV